MHVDEFQNRYRQHPQWEGAGGMCLVTHLCVMPWACRNFMPAAICCRMAMPKSSVISGINNCHTGTRIQCIQVMTSRGMCAVVARPN
jgi:hypothetical protein